MLGSINKLIFQYEKPPFNMTAYSQNKTDINLQNNDCKVVKIRCSFVRNCVGTYPQKRASARFHNLPDEQWEHYTDIEKKCKRFNGIFCVVMRHSRVPPHNYSKRTQKPPNMVAKLKPTSEDGAF